MKTSLLLLLRIRHSIPPTLIIIAIKMICPSPKYGSSLFMPSHFRNVTSGEFFSGIFMTKFPHKHWRTTIYSTTVDMYEQQQQQIHLKKIIRKGNENCQSVRQQQNT